MVSFPAHNLHRVGHRREIFWHAFKIADDFVDIFSGGLDDPSGLEVN